MGVPVICCTWDKGFVIYGTEDGVIAGQNLEDGAEVWRIEATRRMARLSG